MATVYITEFNALEQLSGQIANYGQVAHQGPIAEQVVAIGGASTQSAAFNAKTKLIRVHTDAICSIKVGTNPTALTTSARMAADQTEYFGVVPGQKIAVIANT